MFWHILSQDQTLDFKSSYWQSKNEEPRMRSQVTSNTPEVPWFFFPDRFKPQPLCHVCRNPADTITLKVERSLSRAAKETSLSRRDWKHAELKRIFILPYCTTCVCESPTEHIKCFTDIQESYQVINSKWLPKTPGTPEQGVRQSLDQDIQVPAGHNQTHQHWDEDLTLRCLCIMKK